MDGEVIIPVELDTKSFDKQIEYTKYELERLEEEYESALKNGKWPENELIKYRQEIERARNKLISLNQQKEKLNKKGLSNLKLDMNSIGNTTENVIKKIAKWGLALFSIRSAYSFIRRSVSLLAQSDEQLSADIEYIRWSLATAIKPIVETLVKLAYQLLTYVGFLAKAWFGIDIFSKSTTSEFKKQNKEAKKLQKTLASFDEMNILSKDSGTTTAMPSTDLSANLGDEEAPSWLKTIREVGQWVLDNWEDVISMILLTKTIGNVLSGNWVGVVIDLVAYMIVNLPRLVKAMKNVLDGVISIVGAIVKKLGDFWVWFCNNLIQPIVDLCDWVILQIWQDIQDLTDFVINVLATILNSVISVISTVIGTIGSMWDIFVKGGQIAWEGIKKTFSGLANFFKTIFSDAWNGVKAIFSVGGQIFDGIKEGIVSAFTTIVNAIIGGINKVIAIPFNAINGVLNWIKEIDLPLIGMPFYGFWPYDPIWVPQIPTIPFRKGGIVSYPNQGVPIAGESGQEGIIPLTDTQQMEILGEAIGRYISLNATIPIYVGNRQIAREIRTINAESDYAFNR